MRTYTSPLDAVLYDIKREERQRTRAAVLAALPEEERRKHLRPIPVRLPESKPSYETLTQLEKRDKCSRSQEYDYAQPYSDGATPITPWYGDMLPSDMMIPGLNRPVDARAL